MENEEIQQACAKIIPVAFISIKKTKILVEEILIHSCSFSQN